MLAWVMGGPRRALERDPKRAGRPPGPREGRASGPAEARAGGATPRAWPIPRLQGLAGRDRAPISPSDGGTASDDPPPSRDRRSSRRPRVTSAPSAPVIDGGKVHYHLAGQRGGPAFTDRGKVIDIHDSQAPRERPGRASAQRPEVGHASPSTATSSFARLCVELAVEHGFKIANPELQQAIAADRERLRSKNARPQSPTAAPSLAEAYRRHLAAEVAHHSLPGSPDPSRLDAHVAVRMRVAGYRRDAVAQAIREAAPMHRPTERRDWDRYAQRTVDFAFSLPGSELAGHLARQRGRQRNIEDHQLERTLEARLGGRLKFDR